MRVATGENYWLALGSTRPGPPVLKVRDIARVYFCILARRNIYPPSASYARELPATLGK
jgi:hypothetical protein